MNKILLIFILIFIFINISLVSASNIENMADNESVNNRTDISYQNTEGSFKEIQSMIDLSNENDTISINGTYYGNGAHFCQ